MLHKETISQSTLKLLKSLQNEPELQAFNLVGGTALALRLGHRISVDLDFFTKDEFNLEEVRSLLVHKYNMKVSYARGQTVKGFIDNVKIDCIRYSYNQIQKHEIIEGIRIESTPDIIAMKLAAISDNGTRIKDFIDIATLSSYYSLEQMLDFYEEKYPESNRIMPLKSLTYFNDIDFNEPIIIINGNFDWQLISQRLHKMVNNPDMIF